MKIKIDCRICENCTGNSCKIYGDNADVAVKNCVKDNFNNYKKLNKTTVGFLHRGDHFYFENQKYIILGIDSNKDINDVRCKNLQTNKIELFDVDSDIYILGE